MIAAFPARDLVQLTNEDPQVNTINEAKLQTFLDDATLTVDGFIESRFALPFPTGKVPPLLRQWCVDIAMYRLQGLRPLHDIEDARKRYEDAMKLLRAVADGKLTLGLTAAGKEPAPATPTVLTISGTQGDRLTGQAGRCGFGFIYDRGSLRSF